MIVIIIIIIIIVIIILSILLGCVVAQPPSGGTADSAEARRTAARMREGWQRLKAATPLAKTSRLNRSGSQRQDR